MCEGKLRMGQGNVVTGQRFWDRRAETQLFIQRLDEGAHQLLVAQRRMGKTSLMAEVAELVGDRYVCLFVDLQKSRSAADAVAELAARTRPHAGLWKKVKGLFDNVLSVIKENVEEIQLSELGIKLRSGLNAGNWELKGDQVVQILHESAFPVVILFDEVPILVNRLLRGDDDKVTKEGRRDADQFLSWLRKSSIEHQGSVRMVLTGSIGLEPILHRVRLSATIAGFVPLELKPWDSDTAVKCIRALAAQYKVTLDNGVPERMMDCLGCGIPHHVQMFFSYMHERCVRNSDMRCRVAEVDEVYRGSMLGVRGHVELLHYEERLEEVLDSRECALAFDMVTEAAVVGVLTKEAVERFRKEHPMEGTDIQKVQDHILWVLQHDGYLRDEPQGYVFVSKLIKDWWKNRHERFYTPVLQRKIRRRRNG